jgi:hypothetical protein
MINFPYLCHVPDTEIGIKKKSLVLASLNSTPFTNTCTDRNGYNTVKGYVVGVASNVINMDDSCVVIVATYGSVVTT